MSTLAVTLEGIAPATLTIELGTPGPQGLVGPQGSQGPAGPAGPTFTGGPITSPITYTVGDTVSVFENGDFYVEHNGSGAYGVVYINGLEASDGTNTILVQASGITFGDLTVQNTAFPGFAGYATESWVTDGFYPLAGNPSGFLTASSLDGYATETFVTSQGFITASALTPYLLSSTAASTYQTLSGMSSYLTTSAAASTYQTLSGMSSYLLSSTAASTYQTLSGMSSYLTTSAAASTYAITARGLPSSGTAGQVLTKVNGTNYNATWSTIIPGDRYLTTSSTSNAVSNGAKTFTVGTGLSYTTQQDVTIAYDAAHHMHALVTSYDSGTGVLVVNVQSHTGTGTYTAWTVNVGGAVPVASVVWGDITGTLGSQTDLATALNNKLETSTAATTYYLQTNPSGFIGDAPSDGSQYARKNGAWDIVSGGGGAYITSVTAPLAVTSGDLSVDLSTYLTDAPSDGSTYGRLNGTWAIPPSGVPEAPNDGLLYARSNLGWAATFGDAPSTGYNYGRYNGSWAIIDPPYTNSVWAYGHWTSANVTMLFDPGTMMYYNVLTF